MPRWVTFDQGTDQWLKERIGVLTASRVADAISTQKNGKETESRRKLKIALLAERLTNLATETYVNSAMQWGIEHEAEAKARYEEITGRFVTNCGLALHDEIDYLGASPDGLVEEDGLIEVKCPSTGKHLEYLLSGEVPDQYRPQMLLQLAITGRQWCDFVSYDPRVPSPNDIHIIRFSPTEEEKAGLIEGATLFLNEVETMWEILITKELN